MATINPLNSGVNACTFCLTLCTQHLIKKYGSKQLSICHTCDERIKTMIENVKILNQAIQLARDSIVTKKTRESL